jgi:pimeloyl-ACP methyl ester carboxylesterase
LDSAIIIFAIFVIPLLAIVGLFIYEPSPAKGLTFSSLGKTIQLSDGRTLAYLDIGDPEGRPLFYFHGGPGSRLEGLLFDELNQQLGIRMIAPDRPGFGLSDFQKDRTYLDWPDDVCELAGQIGIDRFAVLGWSSGGPHAAAVAHGIPQCLNVVAIVSGEGPITSDDFPPSVLNSATFSGSRVNKLFVWSANHGPWLMRIFFSLARILIFKDPIGSSQLSRGSGMSAKDVELFTRHEYIASMVEALRQGAEGWTREYTIERQDWPFKLEEIHAPPVLVFHGEEDSGMHPGIAEYVSTRVQSCDEATIYAGEGHSVVYYRYEEIIQAMLEAWE